MAANIFSIVHLLSMIYEIKIFHLTDIIVAERFCSAKWTNEQPAAIRKQYIIESWRHSLEFNLSRAQKLLNRIR